MPNQFEEMHSTPPTIIRVPNTDRSQLDRTLAVQLDFYTPTFKTPKPQMKNAILFKKNISRIASSVSPLLTLNLIYSGDHSPQTYG
jgi:hypothetical protein